MNVNAEKGVLETEALNPSGSVINKGREIISNSTKEPVRWKKEGLESLMGERIRLRFLLKKAELFSFWFE